MYSQQTKLRYLLEKRKSLASRQRVNALLAYPVDSPVWQATCQDATPEELEAALAECQLETGVTATALRNAIASRQI